MLPSYSWDESRGILRINGTVIGVPDDFVVSIYRYPRQVSIGFLDAQGIGYGSSSPRLRAFEHHLREVFGAMGIVPVLSSGNSPCCMLYLQ